MSGTDARYKVYMHVAPNGKKYVGITCRKLEERWGYGGGAYRYNFHFWHAIKKHGWERIEHLLVADGLTRQDAANMEIALIREHQSNNPDYGYNNSEGGGGCLGRTGDKHPMWGKRGEDNPNYGRKRPPEFGRRVSAALMGKMVGAKNPFYGRKHSEQTKAILRQRCAYKPTAWQNFQRSIKYSGAGNPNYGKHATEETKAIWHEQRFGRMLTPEWRQKISENSSAAKPVICIETGEQFASCVRAAAAKGINTPRNIGDVCLGKSKTCGGYHWEFANLK